MREGKARRIYPHQGVPCSEAKRVQSKARGIAFLLAMVIILILSGLALSMVLLTDTQVRLGQTAQAQGRVFYSALAGLEETRGRMSISAPDTVALSMPNSISQVLYLVNSTPGDPVQPTNPTSPYYDTEYSSEFPGGFASASILPNIKSDQPGVGTSTAIPYKWVRITLKTEASAHTDINLDGVFNNTSPIYWDGAQQTLSPVGSLVYVLTSLAVDSTKVEKILQMEVAAATGGFTPLAAFTVGGSAAVSGNPVSNPASIVIDGRDHNLGGTGCPPLATALPGIMAGGTISSSGASLNGNPPMEPSVMPLPQSAANLISQYQPAAANIVSVDPNHVTFNGTNYIANGTTLGTLPSPVNSGTAQVVYADQPLTISGTGNTGYGILLVNGSLSVTGDLRYHGVIIANGQINFTPSTSGVRVVGSMLGAGNSIWSTPSGGSAFIHAVYNSCTLTQVLHLVGGGISSGTGGISASPQILAYRELSF